MPRRPSTATLGPAPTARHPAAEQGRRHAEAYAWPATTLAMVARLLTARLVGSRGCSRPSATRARVPSNAPPAFSTATATPPTGARCPRARRTAAAAAGRATADCAARAPASAPTRRVPAAVSIAVAPASTPRPTCPTAAVAAGLAARRRARWAFARRVRARTRATTAVPIAMAMRATGATASLPIRAATHRRAAWKSRARVAVAGPLAAATRNARLAGAAAEATFRAN